MAGSTARGGPEEIVARIFDDATKRGAKVKV
jgi:hypothetical protein